MRTQDCGDDRYVLQDSDYVITDDDSEDEISEYVQREEGADRGQAETTIVANELELAARVESELRTVFPCEVVKVKDGVFTVDVEAPSLWESRLIEDFNRVAGRIPGVTCVRVHILPSGIHGIG